MTHKPEDSVRNGFPIFDESLISKTKPVFCKEMMLRCTTCPIIVCLDDLGTGLWTRKGDKASWEQRLCADWPTNRIRSTSRREVIDSVNHWIRTRAVPEAEAMLRHPNDFREEEIEVAEILLYLLEDDD